PVEGPVRAGAVGLDDFHEGGGRAFPVAVVQSLRPLLVGAVRSGFVGVAGGWVEKGRLEARRRQRAEQGDREHQEGRPDHVVFLSWRGGISAPRSRTRVSSTRVLKRTPRSARGRSFASSSGDAEAAACETSSRTRSSSSRTSVRVRSPEAAAERR